MQFSDSSLQQMFIDWHFLVNQVKYIQSHLDLVPSNHQDSFHGDKPLSTITQTLQNLKITWIKHQINHKNLMLLIDQHLDSRRAEHTAEIRNKLSCKINFLRGEREQATGNRKRRCVIYSALLLINQELHQIQHYQKLKLTSRSSLVE